MSKMKQIFNQSTDLYKIFLHGPHEKNIKITMFLEELLLLNRILYPAKKIHRCLIGVSSFVG
jgi:hypothetical protein